MYILLFIYIYIYMYVYKYELVQQYLFDQAGRQRQAGSLELAWKD
jgi:hypothetical protein